ncbi:MAG: MauE/DoxX family redox-associated membrane protein [Labedaea sp.]
MRLLIGFSGGAALLLAALLVLAGALKLLRPRSFAHAVYRLLGKHLVRRELLARVAPWTVGAVEVLLGMGVAVAGLAPRAWWSIPITGACAALFLGFVAVVRIAIRKGTSCGCFTSFSDGVAGGAELARAIALAVLALALLAVALTGRAVTWWRWDALAWLAVLVVLVISVVAVSGRTRPSGALLLGRIRSRLARVDLPRASAGNYHRADAIAAARRSPSVVAFERWLGGRAADVDWRRCEIRATAATPPGGPRVPCLVISPHCRGGLTVTVSVPDAGAEHAVVIAVVDGAPLSVIGGTVIERPASPPRPAAMVRRA